MRRPSSATPERALDLADLDALVLAEIESLGRKGRPPGSQRSGPSRPDTQGDGGDTDALTRPSAPEGSPLAGRFHGRRGDRDSDRQASRQASGEEAEGLFDEPFDLGEAPEPPSADGPTAADLLSPEEQAFIARAVGFLAGRPNADLILDRVWSRLIESRPDGLYDPDLPGVFDDPRGGLPGPERPAGETEVRQPGFVASPEQAPVLATVPRIRPVQEPAPPPLGGNPDQAAPE